MSPKDHYPDDNPKTKFGVQKPSMFNVPVTSLLHLMAAMADGAKKYGPYNWRDKDVSASIYYDAAMRHLMAWIDGEDYAGDSGVHHLGGVMACCAIILDAEAQGTLNDNRPVKGKFSELVEQMTSALEKPETTSSKEISDESKGIRGYINIRFNSLYDARNDLRSEDYTIESALKDRYKLKKEAEDLITYINMLLAKIPARDNDNLLVFLQTKKKEIMHLLEEINSEISNFTQFDEFGLPK